MSREDQNPRLVLRNFLSLHECKELEFIHKSSSTVGYRPNVFSTTLSHLIATNSAHFLLPFVPIRERLKEKVEEYFGCEYELFVEFTGLISWVRGANIGWHSDDNRPYLKQRDFSAVCYLNNYGDDFGGGLFRFQDGEPPTIVPSLGVSRDTKFVQIKCLRLFTGYKIECPKKERANDVVIYSADNRNIHSVDEIIEGERLTMALWFSRDSSYDEDTKLISLLSDSALHSYRRDLWLPLPASSNMYWFSPGRGNDGELGFDICWARLHVLGFDVLYSRENSGGYSDISDFLMEPLQLSRGNELFDREFANILHALQGVHYYCWKASESETTRVDAESSKVVLLSESQRQKVKALKSMFFKDDHLVQTVFTHVNFQRRFDWKMFDAAISACDDYACISYGEILKSLPYWRTQQSIFSVSFEEN